MTENLNLQTVDTVDTGPFRKLVMTIGELPTAFVESMTYYELLAWFTNYLETVIIPTVNNNAECVEELQGKFVELKNATEAEIEEFETNITALYNQLHDYVENYFDNLDVQEEINNKLDEMAEDGTLQEIITTYIQSNVAWTFDTVADMKSATNLVAGSYAQTLGYHSINDGGKALYYITNSGTANERDVIAIGSLYANLVKPTALTPEVFGAYGDGTHDDTEVIQHCMDYVSNKPIILLLDHMYLISPGTDASDNSSRKICLNLVTNITMKGLGKNTGFIVNDVNSNSNKYWCVFYSPASATHANVVFENFKIYQNDNNVSSMELNVFNPRYVFCFYSAITNITIRDILFDHVYGRDIIMVNNNATSNGIFSDCVFNFFNIMDRVSAYDCSILFLKMHEYVCENNTMDGSDFACASGIELHGYNGVARNNRVYNFQNGMHIQPSGTKPANLEAENNFFRGYDGINLWDNADSSNYGEDVIRICNNYMQIVSNANTDQYMGGIRTSTSTFTHPIENITISGNTIEFVEISQEASLSPAYCGGIVFNVKIDMKNIIITNNTILSSVSAGIQIGSTAANATNTYSDIIVTDNIIKNNGLVPATNPVYNSTFYFGNGTLKNIKVKDNTIINDISGQGSTYLITRSGTIDTNNPCYFVDNIVKTVNSGYLSYNDGTSGGFIKEDEKRIPIMSPDGSVYYIKAANDGTLSTSANWA